MIRAYGKAESKVVESSLVCRTAKIVNMGIRANTRIKGVGVHGSEERVHLNGVGGPF